MNKPVTLLLATLLAPLSGQLCAQESVTMDGKQYSTIEVNGQTYLIPDNGSKKRVARSLDGKAPQQTLRRGDVLIQGAASPELTVSGTLLVEADDATAKALATRHGLNFKQSSGGIALLEAKPGTDLNAIATKLKSEGVNVQIELSGAEQQPK
ncbi:serine protease chaperone [Aeromonas allosaccharophila]|uniref:serine protease chaperone n=1 Tax=Aeromonas allosaccharophila TaxID=656 RepID=UPI003D1F96AD